MTDDTTIRIGGDGGSAVLDADANILRLEAGTSTLEPFLPYTCWELEGRTAEAAAAVSPGGRVAAHLTLTTRDAEAHLVLEWRKGLRIRLRDETPRGTEPPAAPKHLSFSMTFSDAARFHLPERYNLCRVVDRLMPLHELHEADLRYGFFVVEAGESEPADARWLLFHLHQTGTDVPRVSLSRQPGLFTATFHWNPAHEAVISLRPSLDAALACYHDWLGASMGLTPLADDPAVPQWVHNVKLVITLDMMRSNWEIAHDYADVAALAGELSASGCPADTLFYLPGTNGAYDSMYPDHGPHAELGGADGFRRMVESLHRNGFRVMLHANAWGLDPCHPDVERYLPYVLRDERGDYQGWQTGGTIWGGLTMPPSYSLRYRTGRIPAPASSASTFETEHIPDECEALVSFGIGSAGRAGLPARARVRLTANHRSYVSPEGWFADHEEYAFPFPFLLKAGGNTFRVAMVGTDPELPPEDCWYRVREAFTFVRGCTYPILRADTTNPEWIRIFLDEIVSVVREYDIDAIHVDATHYHRDARILEALRERIPRCAISGEELDSLGDLKMYAFCQNAQMDLLADVAVRRLRQSRYYLDIPDDRQSRKKCRWLDQPSAVWEHLRRYIILYPHLCASDGFAPTAKVCNIRPPVRVPADAARLRQVLRDADRLGYVPGLRLNYREYGLDDLTREAIQSGFR